MIYIEKMLKQKGLEKNALKTKHAHADRNDRLIYCYDLIDNEKAVLMDSLKVAKKILRKFKKRSKTRVNYVQQIDLSRT